MSYSSWGHKESDMTELAGEFRECGRLQRNLRILNLVFLRLLK